jgi:hypothetical protein
LKIKFFGLFGIKADPEELEDFDLDFNKWEKDREWQEYYTKVKK